MLGGNMKTIFWIAINGVIVFGIAWNSYKFGRTLERTSWLMSEYDCKKIKRNKDFFECLIQKSKLTVKGEKL